MTDFWTDKKRGFVGVPGNLAPNTQSLSFQRFMRQELGGLDQTQVKRFTPEGEMTIRAFGNYEKVISELIKKAAEERPVNERLVVFNSYSYPDTRQFARLIRIKPDSYDEIWSVNLTEILPENSTVYNVSWNYHTNKFIVFLVDWYYYRFYEVRVYRENDVQKTEVTLITSIDPYADDWYSHPTGTHNYPLFFHSYGPTGEQNLMWLGFNEYYDGYYYILPLNSRYGFTKKGVFSSYAVSQSNYDKEIDRFLSPLQDMVYEIALADCDSYHHATWNVPTLSWVTFNNVRILKPVTDALANWYGQANQRACEVRNKSAVIYDEDIQEGKTPYAIHLCGAWSRDKIGNNTADTYMDSFSSIKESAIFDSGSSVELHDTVEVLCNIYPPWRHYGIPGYSSLICKNVKIDSVGDFHYHFGIRYVTVIVSWDIDWIYYGLFGTDHNSYIIDFAWPESDNVTFQIDEPDDYAQNPNFTVIGSYYTLFAWVQRETYYDMRHINNHYVVVADKADGDYRIFVADKNGSEKYEIELTDPSTTDDIRIERVIVQ